jgi:hypothetical protein
MNFLTFHLFGVFASYFDFATFSRLAFPAPTRCEHSKQQLSVPHCPKIVKNFITPGKNKKRQWCNSRKSVMVQL